MPERLTGAAAKLRQAIDRLEPALQRAVRKALAALQGAVPEAELVAAIAEGNVFALRQLRAKLTRELQPAVAVLEQAFRMGGETATVRLSGRLDLVNPAAVRAAETLTASLVTGVQDQVRAAIRVVIASAIREGLNSREAAQLLRPLIGLTERQAKAVVNQRAADAAKGLSAEKIQARADRFAATLLRQRAQLIARTELIRASHDGQLAVWTEAQRRGLITANAEKRWIVTHDDRLCPQCSALDGATAPLAGTFRSGGFTAVAPPLHPACRCSLALVTAAVRKAA